MGNVAYVSLSPTRLNVDAGAVDRASGLVSAGLCVLWIFLGPELTARVPKFVVGGWLGAVRGKKGSCFSQHSGIQKCLTFRLLVLCRVELPGLHEVRHTFSTLLLCYFWTV